MKKQFIGRCATFIRRAIVVARFTVCFGRRHGRQPIIFRYYRRVTKMVPIQTQQATETHKAEQLCIISVIRKFSSIETL